MIRYYLDTPIPLMAAAQCAHPSLARLRGKGPWKASEIPGGVMLQRGEAEAWGDIKPGLSGLRYQIADPMPDFLTAIKINERGPVAWLELAGIRLPIKLAAFAPVVIGLDGQPEGVCDEYGITASALWDRWQTDDLPITDPQLLAFCNLALMSQTDLTPELIYAYKLRTTDTVPAIFGAATGCDPKKVEAPEGGG